MLSTIFELRIDWYTNKDQCSSTANEMIYYGIPICIPTEQYQWCTQNEFVNNQSTVQRDRTVLLNVFFYRPIAQRDHASDSVILCTESYG